MARPAQPIYRSPRSERAAVRPRLPPRRRRSPLGAIIRAFATLILFAALLIGLAGTVYLLREVPSAGPAQAELMEQASARGAAWVPIDQVPISMQQAIIATEDARFYDHRGLDILGMIRATIANVRAGHPVQGGSTISQQLAKRYLERTDPTAERKLLVLAMTAKLELRYTKAEILEMYLNSIYYGPYAYGLASAANVYFHKPVAQLTLPESTILAGLPQAPSIYDPLRDLQRVKVRQGVVIAAMERAGFLTSAQSDSVRTARTALDP